MAASTSFKQQCPSCEAMVPIRDPALVGRKIDCPKCKYRFVVEKPKANKDEDDGDDTPAPAKKTKKANGAIKAGKPAAASKVKTKPGPRRRDDDDDDDDEDDRPKKKKKSGSSMTIYLGAGLGVLALILLVIGGLAMAGFFGGGSNNSKSSSSSPGPGNSSAPTPPTPVQADNNKPPPPPPLAVADISNLLPNDSEAVVNYPIEKMVGSGLGQAALQTTGAFSEKGFRNTFSFPFYDAGAKDGVARVVTAVSNSNHWVFSVLRTLKPINKDQVSASLQLEAHDPVNGLVAYSVHRDLDSLSNLLIKANRPHPDLQLCFLDAQTLVFADPAPMDKFLQDKGKPKQLTQPPAAAPPPGGSTPPPGASSMIPPGGSSSSLPPGGSSTMPTPGGSSTSPMPPPGGSSTMPMPGGSSTMPMPGGSSTMPMPGGSTPPNGTTPPPPPPPPGAYLTIDPGMKALFDRIDRPDQPALFSVVLSGHDPMLDALVRYGQSRAPGLPGVPGDNPLIRPFLDQAKTFKVQDTNIRMLGLSVTEFSQQRVAAVAAVDLGTELVAKPVVAFLQPLIPLANTILTGGALPLGPNGTTPGASSTTPGASSGSPMPMPTPMPTPPSSSSSSPGITPNNPGGNPTNPNEGQGPLSLVQDKGIVVLYAAVPFANLPAYQETQAQLGQVMVRLKGAADMVATRSRIYDLSAALQAYVKDKGHFPRGTADRRLTADRFIEWSPNDRVSWMADLLPYLGDDFRDLRIDREQSSWREGPNLQIAGVVVPPFIGHGDPSISPLLTYPGVPQDVAATHYVGVAGVGLDAADYPPGNPKNGVFGYNRETKPDEVKDGLDKTIVLLQIPAGQKTPWLAGGGATVRGVSEGPDAVQQFVCADYQGKRGTFAVMGDGKVRFIAETIDPNLFRAMCTIAGNEMIDNLDEIAPVVPNDAPVAAAPPPPDMGPQGPPPPPPGPPPTPPGPPPAPPAAKIELPAGWTAYTSKDGGYSVHLPPLPFGERIETTRTPEGEWTLHHYAGPAPNNGGMFMITYADIPGGAPPGDQTEAVLDSKQKGLTAFIAGGKITSQTKITLDGNPGRDLTAEGAVVPRLRVRIYVVKGRIYEIMAAGQPNAVGDKDMAAFVESFQLTGK